MDRVGVGAGRDREGFLYNRCVWVLDGSGRLTLCYGLFVPLDECGQREAGSVIGVCLILRAGLDLSLWYVGTLLSVWRWGRRIWGQV